VPLLIGGWPASAEAFFVDIEVSIVWTNPQSFPNTFSGDSFFPAGDFCPTDPTAFCGIPFGAHTYTDVPVEPADPIDIFFPPDPILPNDTIVWQFAGFIHAGPETFFPTFAFPPGPGTAGRAAGVRSFDPDRRASHAGLRADRCHRAHLRLRFVGAGRDL
jgi:hypothetical protein